MPISTEIAFSKLKDPNVKRIYDFNIFLINIATMYRNNYSSDMGSTDIFNAFVKDIQFIVRYIEDFVSKNRKGIVLFYFFDYTKLIPADRIRENAQVAMFRQISKIINKYISPPNVFNPISDPLDPLDVFVCNMTSALPYKVLSNAVTIPNPRIALISHIAWDFLFIKNRRAAIIESFTGNIVNVTNLNDKVFKDKNIPFNELTYNLLGDKYLFKPIIIRKQRKQFDELAKKYNFKIKTTNFIKGKLLEEGVINKEDLKINFI